MNLQKNSPSVPGLLDRIGLLAESEVAAVMRAYLLIRQMPERLELIRELGTKDERYERFVRVGGKLFATAKQMHENYLEDIDAAISVLPESGDVPSRVELRGRRLRV